MYPYAAGGPRTYTPPNQPLSGSFAPWGWYQGSPGLLPFLQRMGFPKHAPVVATGVVNATPTSGSWPVWAWILLAAGMGAALLLIASRQRRRVLA